MLGQLKENVQYRKTLASKSIVPRLHLSSMRPGYEAKGNISWCEGNCTGNFSDIAHLLLQ